ncbi:MAG: hypothetical protein AUG74_01510 [Bacteroidetes bacterium 13_1_20CM_4_60_6]|nr:MAG: hypothetical protein AUG74_01510 [Bacteroidetes bacterium 13_1_20CM_4_60_6]
MFFFLNLPSDRLRLNVFKQINSLHFLKQIVILALTCLRQFFIYWYAMKNIFLMKRIGMEDLPMIIQLHLKKDFYKRLL